MKWPPVGLRASITHTDWVTEFWGYIGVNSSLKKSLHDCSAPGNPRIPIRRMSRKYDPISSGVTLKVPGSRITAAKRPRSSWWSERFTAGAKSSSVQPSGNGIIVEEVGEAYILIGPHVGQLFVRDANALPNLVYVNNLIRFAVFSPVFWPGIKPLLNWKSGCVHEFSPCVEIEQSQANPRNFLA